MSNDCKYFKNLMQAALDGVLAGGEKADFDRHLAMCRGCRAEFRAFQLSLDLLAALPVPEPGPGFMGETVKKAFLAKQKQRRQHRAFSWIMALVILSASAFTVIGWLETAQPAIGRMLSGLLHGFSEFWALISGLVRMVSALVATLGTLIKVVPPLSSSGWEMFYTEVAIGLAFLLSLAFILQFRRFKARKMIFSF